MHLIAIMPARNESWVIGLSLRVALKWCDEVVVLDHASTDDTPAIVSEVADENPGRVHILIENNPEWAEMAHRQRLLESARGRGATHIALVDADEVLCGDMLPVIRQEIESLGPGQLIHAAMPCTWRSLDQYRVGRSIWANRFDLALAFGDRRDLLWRAANGYDHHHREPYGAQLARRLYAGSGVMHLQFASWRRLTAKHRAYKIMERLKYPDKPVAEIDRTYSLALDERGLCLADAPESWWEPYRSILGHVDLNAVPWQEAECERLLALHGRDRFAGLDLFEEAPCR